jgi:hypothetical protein
MGCIIDSHTSTFSVRIEGSFLELAIPCAIPRVAWRVPYRNLVRAFLELAFVRSRSELTPRTPVAHL